MIQIQECVGCGEPIPEERLEAIPGVQECVRCSSTQRLVGFNIYAHSKGTAPELVVVVPTDKEQLRLADRANRRKR